MASLEELGRRRRQGDPTAHMTLGGELCTGSEVRMLHSNTVTASINTVVIQYEEKHSMECECFV